MISLHRLQSQPRILSSCPPAGFLVPVAGPSSSSAAVSPASASTTATTAATTTTRRMIITMATMATTTLGPAARTVNHRKQQQQPRQQLLSSPTKRCSSALVDPPPSVSADSSTASNNNNNTKYYQDELLSLLPGCSQPLGMPLPIDEHACSVSLPTWASVVGYEEGDPSITAALRTGYPRFVYHPYVLQLMQHLVEHFGSGGEDDDDDGDEEDCLLLPTAAAAARCQAFLQRALERQRGGSGTVLLDNALINHSTTAALDERESKDNHINNPHQHPQRSRIRRVSVPGGLVHAVLFPAETAAGAEAKAYWQHAGEVVSSRRAERALRCLQVPLAARITNDDSGGSDSSCGAPHVCHSAFPEEPVANTTEVDCDSRKNNSNYQPARELRARIAEWAGLPEHAGVNQHVFLTPSGMAAIYTALRSTRRYQMQQQQQQQNARVVSDGGTSIVYGFPYLDTLKVCSRPEICPGGVEFFGRGDARDLAHLEQLLEKSKANDSTGSAPKKVYCGLFTEVPSNPLLQCPDLHRLRELADEYDFCLVVDDTISNFLNVDVLSTGLADAVCTSLTKIVSGRGDAIAGSIVTNPHTPRGRWMQQDLVAQQQQSSGGSDNHDDDDNNNSGLYCQDAHAVLCNSADFAERNAAINETAEALADWLAEQPDVQTVFYPKHSCAETYRKLLRTNNNSNTNNTGKQHKAGYGGLMSILLHPHMCQRLFFDSLDVAKGPSLGTNFTLVCPYTLLAHYHELDFAMSYNVPPNLLRISVGLEPLAELQDKFGTALAQSRLYPKPTIQMERSSAATNSTSTTARSFSTWTGSARIKEQRWAPPPPAPCAAAVSAARTRQPRMMSYRAQHTLRRLSALVR